MKSRMLKIQVILVAATLIAVATTEDMNKALSEAKAVPYFENGQPAGYQKVEAQPGVEYQNLSVQNGEAVSAPDSAGNVPDSAQQ